MTAGEVIDAVRAAGADIAIDGDGPRIRGGSRLPASLVALCREHRAAIIAELQPKPAQMPLELDADPPVPFLDREDARFNALLAEFGIQIR